MNLMDMNNLRNVYQPLSNIEREPSYCVTENKKIE